MTYTCSTIMYNEKPCPNQTTKSFKKCGRHDKKCKSAVADARKKRMESGTLVRPPSLRWYGVPENVSPMKRFLSDIDNPERDVYYDNVSQRLILFVNGIGVDSYRLDDVINSMRIYRSR